MKKVKKVFDGRTVVCRPDTKCVPGGILKLRITEV
jgi:hypothetical protein